MSEEFPLEFDGEGNIIHPEINGQTYWHNSLYWVSRKGEEGEFLEEWGRVYPDIEVSGSQQPYYKPTGRNKWKRNQ